MCYTSAFVYRITKGFTMDSLSKPDALFELSQVCQMPADEVRGFINSAIEECASYKFQASITAWDPFNVANL